MPAFSLKCSKCGAEFHRHWSSAEFDKLQYTGKSGIACFTCGWPRMAVIRSNRTVKDGFTPGFQRNIMKHCATYSEYKAHLKNMGLIEIGYEEVKEGPTQKTKLWSDKMLKKMYNEYGIKFSDREAMAMQELDNDGKEVDMSDYNPQNLTKMELDQLKRDGLI